jgi:type IV pilus assembly protein PilA
MYSKSFRQRQLSIKSPRNQAGFTLIELGVVTVLLVIALIFLFPFFKQLIDESKTPAAAGDMQKISAKILANHSGGNTAYTTSTSAEIAGAAAGMSSIYKTIGSGSTATVEHNFGASGASVTFGPATITNTDDAGLITINDASKGTCPGLPSALQKVAQVMTVNGTSVKAAGGTYDAAAASAACVSGDENDYTITIR